MVSLNSLDKKIIKEYADSIRTNFPGVVNNIILYGSKARGDSHRESDIDMLVVIDSNDKKAKRVISDLSWDVMVHHDFKAYISSIVFFTQEYEQYKQWHSSFLTNVLHEGVKV
jgi:predicted nucleotidyltransferase